MISLGTVVLVGIVTGIGSIRSRKQRTCNEQDA